MSRSAPTSTAMMTQGWKQPQPPHLIAINVDPADASKNYLPDVLIEADAAEGADALAERIPERGGLDALGAAPARAQPRRPRRARGDRPRGARLPRGDRARRAGRRRRGLRHVHPGLLAGRLPPHAGAAQARLPARLGHARLRVPAGRSAPRWRAPGPVVSVSGDGGFLYACGELATLAQERIPLTAVIVDDGGYGMLRFDQDLQGRPARGRRPAHARLRGAGALVRRARRRGGRPRASTSRPCSATTCASTSRPCSWRRRRCGRRRTSRPAGIGR